MLARSLARALAHARSPFFLIRPVITFLSLLVANIAYFWQHHKTEGPLQLIFSAAMELVGAVWGFLLAETGKHQARVDYWRAEKGAQIDRYVPSGQVRASGPCLCVTRGQR